MAKEVKCGIIRADGSVCDEVEAMRSTDPMEAVRHISEQHPKVRLNPTTGKWHEIATSPQA